jgi:hypothetical protein
MHARPAPARSWKPFAGAATLGALLFLAAGGAAARAEGILLGIPAAWLAGGVLAAVGLLWYAARGARTGLADASGLVPIPLLLLAGLTWSGQRALSGAPLFALAAACLALSVRGLAWRGDARLLFVCVTALYAGVAARVQAQVGPQGDEPHYLMVADSILKDGDVSLESDYAAGRYRAFHPSDLAPHYRVRGKGGEIYSLHAVGLSLLILPAYALGGYPAVSWFMALLAALLVREIRQLVARTWDDERLADAAAWTLALSPPLIHYAGLVFSEVPAALLLCVCLRRLLDPRVLGGAAAWLTGAGIAFLPWLNVRYAPLSLILIALAAWGRPPWRAALGLLTPALASAAAIAAYHWFLYGFFDPRRVYGRRPELAWSALPEGLAGILFDQEFGLLVYAPVFVLAVPGLAPLARAQRRLAAASLAAVVVVMLTAGSWHMWRGGFNPPARFLVPIVPALALGVAAALRQRLTAPAALLAGWSVFCGLAGAAEPRLVHRDRDGTAPLFRRVSGAEEWTRLLPGYVLAESAPDRARLTLVWAAALLLAASARRQASPARVLVAGAGLVAACTAAGALTHARTGGRDAVRLVGREALLVPGWRPTARAAAEWGPDELTWGPVYEPHRHPEGAEVGSRLPLPAGRYVLTLAAEPLGPDAPTLAVAPGPSLGTPMTRTPQGFEVAFEVTGGREVGLALRGGSPLVLKGIRLQIQPSVAGPV